MIVLTHFDTRCSIGRGWSVGGKRTKKKKKIKGTGPGAGVAPVFFFSLPRFPIHLHQLCTGRHRLLVFTFVMPYLRLHISYHSLTYFTTCAHGLSWHGNGHVLRYFRHVLIFTRRTIIYVGMKRVSGALLRAPRHASLRPCVPA